MVRDRFTRVILSGVLALTVLTRLRPEKPGTSPHLKLLALDKQSPPRSDKWSCAFNSLSKVLHVGFTGLPTDLWAWKKGYGEMPIDRNDNCKVMTWMLNREYAIRRNHQPEIVLTSTVSEKYFMMFSTCQILQQVWTNLHLIWSEA